jgi:hypothetical protein
MYIKINKQKKYIILKRQFNKEKKYNKILKIKIKMYPIWEVQN